MVDFENQEFWKDLTYTVQEKTKKLVILRDEINKMKGNLIPNVILPGFCLLYVILFNQRYFNYISSMIATSKAEIPLLIKSFDLFILVLLICSWCLLYINLQKLNKEISDYENLRKNVIQTINSEFCNHTVHCNCKDKYIKFMKKEKIDLIF